MNASKILIMLALAVVLAGCLRVPLETTVQGNHVEVSVVSFGEYFTSVGKIRLSEAISHTVVWELTPRTGNPGFWKFTLQLGRNPAVFDGIIGGQYRVVVPRGGGSFFLRGDTTYLLEVWNKSGLRCSTARIRLPGK